ncbi:ATP-binding protein [Oceaniglobus roseus]|uniref:ATP-binding protein n=1 Tax=Oceaniglobus roseus TaxID=1737570 RepID=UPI000C7F401E|nr:ATP-binding protein [Kandeliimicrobium roseum]
MRLADSLARRLALLVSVGIGAIWLLAVLAMALVLRLEMNEMQDLELREAARLFLPSLSREHEADLARTESFRLPPDPRVGDELLVFLLLDRDNRVLMVSSGAEQAELPKEPPHPGFIDTATHRFYSTGFNDQGYAVAFGSPLEERGEAYRDSLTAFLLPMLALLPLAYLLTGWISRIALSPLDTLRREIQRRGETSLAPLGAGGQPRELRIITAALNRFMIRLAQTLEGERAFATNAAHELRTPVAAALAQIQRARAQATAPEVQEHLDRAADEIRRMSRLVARLLQLARAEAGIGTADTAQDLGRLLRFTVEERRHGAGADGRLRLSLPDAPVFGRIDPDAFAIVAGNLIDNALQHSPPGSPVDVVLDAAGTLAVTNDGPPVPPEVLARLTDRHSRSGGGSGFGLGLYVSELIAKQAGGSLSLASPAPGRGGGFEARLNLPGA